MNNFILKLLTTQVQVKEIEDIDIKKLQKELKKNGIKLTKEELQQKLQEYNYVIEERRKTKLCNIAYIMTITLLILMSIQEYLQKINVLQFSNVAQILFVFMGFSLIGFTWLFYYLQLKKKYKLYYILLVAALLIEAGLIIAICLL